MDRKQSNRRKQRNRKTRTEEVSSHDKKAEINLRRSRSRSRKRQRSQCRDNKAVQQMAALEDVENDSEEAGPSAALFSHCGQPEEQSEVQTSPSKSSQDTPQEMNGSKKPQPQAVSETLHNIQTEHEQQISSKDAQIELEKLKAEIADLEKEVEDMKLEVHDEKQLRALVEQNFERTNQSYLKDKERARYESHTKAEQLEADLVNERAQVQMLAMEKETARKTVERFQDSQKAQLEETRKIKFALKKAEDLLETKDLCWQQERTSLLEKMEKMEKSRALYEDQLETERLCWQQERTSLLEKMEKSRALYEDQLDQQEHEKRILVDTLRNVGQKAESEQLVMQEEKTHFIQAREGIKKALQKFQQEAEKTFANTIRHQEELQPSLMQSTDRIEKMQKEREEWEEKESSMESQLKEPTSKKKKKKTVTLDEAIRHQEELQPSLMQSTDSIEKMQQEREEEWVVIESSMMSQLKEPTSKKKKGKKWYSIIFPCIFLRSVKAVQQMTALQDVENDSEKAGPSSSAYPRSVTEDD